MTTKTTKPMMQFNIELDFKACEEDGTSDGYYDEMSDHQSDFQADCYKKAVEIAENWVCKHYDIDSYGHKIWHSIPWEQWNDDESTVCHCEAMDWEAGNCWAEFVHDLSGGTIYEFGNESGVEDCPCVDCNNNTEYFKSVADYYKTTVEEHFKKWAD